MLGESRQRVLVLRWKASWAQLWQPLFSGLMKIRKWEISFLIQRPMPDSSKCLSGVSLIGRYLKENEKILLLPFSFLCSHWNPKWWRKLTTLEYPPFCKENHIPGWKDGWGRKTNIRRSSLAFSNRQPRKYRSNLVLNQHHDCVKILKAKEVASFRFWNEMRPFGVLALTARCPAAPLTGREAASHLMFVFSFCVWGLL